MCPTERLLLGMDFLRKQEGFFPHHSGTEDASFWHGGWFSARPEETV
jgi:hypothetical protein